MFLRSFREIYGNFSGSFEEIYELFLRNSSKGKKINFRISSKIKKILLNNHISVKELKLLKCHTCFIMRDPYICANCAIRMVFQTTTLNGNFPHHLINSLYLTMGNRDVNIPKRTIVWYLKFTIRLLCKNLKSKIKKERIFLYDHNIGDMIVFFLVFF